jgi:lysophospholipase L1-like esterase
MFVLPLPFGYLGVMAIWVIVLVALFYGLLRLRQKSRGNRGRLLLTNAGLSLAMLLAVCTAAELGFACFADFSDTFNVTNVSKRWLVLHLDQEKNNEGFRDRNPFTKFVGPGQKRIVFLGDSFTVGHGIKNIDDRFSDRIAAWLEAKEPGKYVVANLAEPGLEASQLEGRAKALFLTHSDVSYIIYVYNLNDIEGYAPEMQQSLGQIYTAEPRNPLFRDTYLLNWLYFRYVQFRYAKGTSYYSNLAAAYRSPAWSGTGMLRAKLAQLARECAEEKVDFRMVIFPFVQDLKGDDVFRDARSKIVDLCKSQKVPVLDLEPVLRAHADENLTVSRFDAHPNERAHALAAEAIEKDLLGDLVAPKKP